MKKQLIIKAIKLFKNTLNKKSKFYNEDLNTFKSAIALKSLVEIKSTISNMEWLQSKESDVWEQKEIQKLDKAGMFNINNLSSKYALS